MRRAPDRDGAERAAGRVENGDLLGETLGDPELAVGRELDVVGATGNLIGAHRRQRGRVERRGGAVDPVVDVEQLAIGRAEDLVRAAPGHDPALDMSVDRVDHRHVIGAHVGHQQLAVLPKHAGRRVADLDRPTVLEPVEIISGQAVGALQRDVSHAGVRARTRYGSASSGPGSVWPGAWWPRRKRRPGCARDRSPPATCRSG